MHSTYSFCRLFSASHRSPSMPGNYDVIQQPRNISSEAKKNIPFYMFIDEETEAFMRNASILGSSRRVGLWRIIVVQNIPYADSRRNGKVGYLLFASYNNSNPFIINCKSFNISSLCNVISGRCPPFEFHRLIF